MSCLVYYVVAMGSSGIRFSVPSIISLNGFPQALVFEVCINSSDAVLIILIFSFESSTTIPVIKLSNTCAYLLIFSCGSVKVFVLHGCLINKHLFYSFFWELEIHTKKSPNALPLHSIRTQGYFKKGRLLEAPILTESLG